MALGCGASFTSQIELFFFLTLPGLVTGIGMRILLERSQPVMREKEHCWLFATSQIQLAKIEGVYATPVEAAIARNSQGWGGAKVVKFEVDRMSPNRWGSLIK